MGLVCNFLEMCLTYLDLGRRSLKLKQEVHFSLLRVAQEARGLDAGPRLVQRLVGFGDLRTSNIVARIADEEVAHVAVGVHWFVDVCQKMGRKPEIAFKGLVDIPFPSIY